MSLKGRLADMRKNIRAAYKSEDTEEWFDKVFTKPLGYLWALLFMKMKWTPNMVTLLSTAIGLAGGILFVSEVFWINLVGVLLVVWANLLDSTDGQMARLTGMKSKLGRILDGLSTIVWYVAIYCALCARLMDDAIPFLAGRTWSGWIWPIAIICAIFGHFYQCALADYYRNIHLYFLKGKHGSELERSSELKVPDAGAFEKIYMYFYRAFTRVQELSTPGFQRLRNALRDKYGADIPDDVREEYLRRSRKYIQLSNILTFNARAYTLFACVLIGIPIIYFPIELILFGALALFMKWRYERIAAEVLAYVTGAPAVKTKRKKYPLIFFAIGFAGVVIMLWRMDIAHLDWDTVVSLMPRWLPVLLTLYIIVYLLHTLAFKAILGADSKKFGIFRLFRITISCFAMNNVTPVSFMGGEPFRIIETKNQVGVAKATASTITFTVLNTISNLMAWFTAATAFFVVFRFSSNVFRTSMMALLWVCCFGLCAAFLFARNKNVLLSIFKTLSKLPLVGRVIWKFTEKYYDTINGIDEEMRAFKAQGKRFWLAIGLEYLTRLMDALEFYLIFKVLGADVSYFAALLSVSLASIFGTVMFIIPMQLGAREGGVVLALSWFSIGAPFGITASLLSRMREIIFTAIGVIMLLFSGGDDANEMMNMKL